MLDKLRGNFKNYFSNIPKAAFIVMLMAICVSITIINAKKTIVVVIDGNSTQITTYRSSLKGALRDGNIQVYSKDKVSLEIKSKVKNGDKIIIKRAVDIAINVDGKNLKIKSAEGTIEEMLRAEKITLSEDDKVSPAKSSGLVSGVKVDITRVDAKVEVATQNLDYSTVVKNDDNLEKGVNQTIQDGEQGSKELSFKVIYENGIEVSRNLVKEVITKNPVEKIVAVGTLGVVNSNRGEKLFYTNSVSVKATAYSAGYASTGKNPGDYGFGVTATGTRAKRTVDGYSSIAVDPRVIPLGTKLYIPGYGSAIAEDVGSGIKGNKIDVYFDSESQALNWGEKWLTVYILK